MNNVCTRLKQSVDTPWITSMPAEWSLKPIKRVLNQVCRPVGESASETTLLSLTQKGVLPRDLESGKGKFPSDFSSYQRVFPQELIFCLFDIDETPRAVGLSSLEGMVTGAYSVFQVKKSNDPRFVSYLFHWIDDEKALKPYYTGLRKVVRTQTFGAIKIPLPPAHEQVVIAKFLDHETEKINALIANQERLIELLQEKRQAVISHAVTKGIDPLAPMKDSGVEWLGEVPGHWSTAPMRRILKRIEQGWSPECIASPADENNWGVVKAGCVNRGVFDPLNNKTLPANLEPPTEYEIQAGDLLMCRASGSPDLIGSAAYIEKVRPKLLLSDKIFRLRTTKSVDNKYLADTLGSAPLRHQIRQSISGAVGLANNLPQSEIKNFVVPLPPREEQEKIHRYIVQETEELQKLLDNAASLIMLLKERRSTLIYAAVTGQIDVRNFPPEEATP